MSFFIFFEAFCFFFFLALLTAFFICLQFFCHSCYWLCLQTDTKAARDTHALIALAKRLHDQAHGAARTQFRTPLDKNERGIRKIEQFENLTTNLGNNLSNQLLSALHAHLDALFAETGQVGHFFERVLSTTLHHWQYRDDLTSDLFRSIQAKRRSKNSVRRIRF